MSILGKVLAVLNVLAAALFIFLAAADYGRRQTWTYAVYRLDLDLDGLPVDADQRDADGGRAVDKVSDKTMQEMFRSVGGVPANLPPEERTQLAEVRRVHDKLKQDIDQSPPPQRLAKARSLVLPLQRTQRDRILMYQRFTKEKPDDLLGPEGPFEKAFSEVLAPQSPAGKPWTAADRKAAIAHLLFNLNPDRSAFNLESLFNLGADTEWGERVQVVVGQAALADEVNRQASAVAAMTDEVKTLVDQDRARFEARHRQVIGELQVLAQGLANRRTALATATEQLNRHKVLLTARQQDLAALRDKLETSRERADKAAKELEKLETRLFKAKQDVGKGLDRTRELEGEIRAIENTK